MRDYGFKMKVMTVELREKNGLQTTSGALMMV